MLFDEKLSRLLILIANLINVFNTQQDQSDSLDESSLEAFGDFINSINRTKALIDNRLEE
jgi:hypothetical protein